MVVQFRAPATTFLSLSTLDGVSIADRPFWTNRIHALCTTHADVDAALRLLDRLRLRGYRPTSPNLATIVHALCDARRSHEAHHRLLLSAAAGHLPDDRTANVLFARLLDANTPNLTLRLLAASPALTPSLTNYNRLLHLLCANSHPLHALRLLYHMLAKGRYPNAVSYTTLINGFSHIGELDTARRLFDTMSHSGIQPNSLTFSVLIKGVLRKRRVDEARALTVNLWAKMEEEDDRTTNNAAFANLIGSLCREGFFHEVFRIAEEMPQGKCIGEEFAYGQMMDSLCRAGRHHGASRIVYIMRKKGFVPSLASYNCIVHGLSVDRGCMRAYQLLKEGVVFRYLPSEPTYKVLVEALCKEKDLIKAKDVAECMLQSDGFDNKRIYNIFLSALRLVENPSEQLNVLVSMLQKQCNPDVVTLNTVIHGFCKNGKVDEAKRILDDMMTGNFCAPDVVTFTTIIRGLLDIGKPEEALDFFCRRMSEFSCPPNVVTYNTVLGGLCKCERINEVWEIFNDMLRKGVTANSTTYTLIIGGLCQVGRLEEAKKFWDDVVWPSKIHDDYVYATILRGLCRLGKLNEACDFLYELVDCGVAPGIVNYNILIDNACKIGLRREAYEILGEMRNNGLVPDPVTWRILDKFHEKEKEKEASVGGSQISDTELIAEETSLLTRLNDGTTSTFHIEEELDSNIETYADPLEGLVDPILPLELMEEPGIDGGRRVTNARDIIEEKPLQPNTKEPLSRIARSTKEPLSRIARRVFGLL